MTNREVVFITGASSGIGWATARRFAAAGYNVVGTARRSERLHTLEAEIAALPEPHGEFLGIACDVTDPQAMQAAVADALARFGRLDVLVANAGVGHRGSITDSDWEGLKTLLRTNIDGVMLSIQAAVPAMRQTGGGHIITISSVASSMVSPYAATYAASKAFVTSIAHSLRLELEADHIRVTDFLVGRTNTEFNEKRLGEGKRPGSGVPTMSPDTVAEAILNAIGSNRKSVTLRFFDWMILIGSRLVPGLIGQFAKRQYR